MPSVFAEAPAPALVLPAALLPVAVVPVLAPPALLPVAPAEPLRSPPRLLVPASRSVTLPKSAPALDSGSDDKELVVLVLVLPPPPQAVRASAAAEARARPVIFMFCNLPL